MPFDLGLSCPDDFQSLLEMYRSFSPKPASQGVPPEDPETCHCWLTTLFRIGESLLAWRGDQVIGHAVLVPDDKKRTGEFVIFVHQDHRNLGIGTELTRFIIERSKRLGLNSVWLTVSMSNSVAIKLYKKLGFEYVEIDGGEGMMRIQMNETPPHSGGG